MVASYDRDGMQAIVETGRRWALVLTAALACTACASLPRLPYTAAEAEAAVVGSDTRSWGDAPDAAFEKRVRASIAKASRNGQRPAYLTLSGGGGDGAYGAGILNGWTESGRRPEFTIVAGVSTGALIAPFAFMGPRYDATVKDLYTSGVASSLLESPDLVSAIFGASIFSNDRLRELVARYVTPDFVTDVARESERGRMLFVLTTNLDSQRPVLWDMGAIARGNTPDSIQRFRDVLVASAAIPAVFPPILLDADANGRTVQELHVDGSVSANVFTLPRTYLSARDNRSATRGGVIYIVLNTSPKPAFQVTDNITRAVAERTISMGFKEQVRDDLTATYAASRQIGFDFNLTYIDEDGSSESGLGFDTARMRKLYETGYERGRTGRFWRKTPPSVGAEPPTRRMPLNEIAAR